MIDYSYISNADPAYIDHLYQTYLRNPQLIDPDWQKFFEGYSYSKYDDANQTESQSGISGDSSIESELNVRLLIEAYRNRAHLISDTNPIRKRKNRDARLDLSDFHLQEKERTHVFIAGRSLGLQNATLDQIVEKLQAVYCGKIGFELQHLESMEKRKWLLEKIEADASQPHFNLNIHDKKQILHKLNGAVIFEKFLHTKYVGQKRFSLEGGESTIPALEFIAQEATIQGVEEVVLGMAHRGRLNVLANIAGKTYEQIFNEFEGHAIPDMSFGGGDVKYHLGFSSQILMPSGHRVQIKLAPNPSHLEAVNPVVEGLARAKADLIYQSQYDKILPILIHGDSAIAGQGIVYETVQMSKLDGYYAGGTIHFVINNQIGFTTDFDDARSSTYCTAAANTIQAPVFHVNGDDPEAVVYVAKLAVAYRQRFNEDVFIDMVCYRRHGHNEGDDPKFTQPLLYSLIQNHPNVRELYIETLTQRGDIEAVLAREMEREFWTVLQQHLEMVKEKPLPYVYQEPELSWKSLKKLSAPEDFDTSPHTGIDLQTAENLFAATIEIPEGFRLLPKTGKIFKNWKTNLEQKTFDWSMAEILAYASILSDGKNVRLSGQDVKRGTFSHRHAVIRDEINNVPHNRLSKLSKNQGQFFIYNSLLSEFAVLGFEYGYSLASPDHLVLWEAQFGDFSNGAQVVLDQFIASGQSKWNRMSGLVLLLPHGYDGQGPEHSSARLERFLQACSEFNMIVANVSTPANFFHILRRQLQWNFRKPLIMMSPKSLLRHSKCVSPLKDFDLKTKFMEVITDIPGTKEQTPDKIVLCSGQIYYDLADHRDSTNQKNIGIARVEQLYPFPKFQISKLLRRFPKAKYIWCQEEPMNMGAAQFIKDQLTPFKIEIVARPAASSPAVGFKKIHDLQHQALLTQIFS
ncbi:MAG: 2-oxoglutarate dehydrogenase E1 component [Saprospiraceae bacterium]|nr:2-oxoglutarate dehydrogenase E1 component [Saprospiraceae bacterium]